LIKRLREGERGEAAMRSQVRFDVIDPPTVGYDTDYSALGLDAEVVDGKLIALIVEVEHDDTATIAEISQAARGKLRNLITLIRLGLRRELVLGAMRFKSLSPDTPLKIVGAAYVTARAAVYRGLLSMPLASLVSALEHDSRLRRQLEYLDSASTTEDTITKIRYAYQVLELEKLKGDRYKPLADFSYVRHAVSHPELDNRKAKSFFQQRLGVDYPDLHNPKHMAFLAKQCKLLMEEAIRLCEEAIQKFQKFW
jgi:hypothetical protein